MATLSFSSSVMFYINIEQHSINPDDYILALHERTKGKINWVLEKKIAIYIMHEIIYVHIYSHTTQ